MRSWYDSHPGAKRGAFAPEGKGTGIKGDRAFPVKEATELLKLKCVSFSVRPSIYYWQALEADITDIGPNHTTIRSVRIPNHRSLESSRRRRFRQHPIPLWTLGHCYTRVSSTFRNVGTKLTYRHVCEHVLRQLSRVVARDSSIAVAGVQDLYVALCEDESIWGLFKRLQGTLS